MPQFCIQLVKILTSQSSDLETSCVWFCPLLLLLLLLLLLILILYYCVHRVLIGKPEGKRPLGRPRRRWEDNIKMDLREVGGGGGDLMELAQDRDRWRALVGTVKNLRVPKMRGIS